MLCITKIEVVNVPEDKLDLYYCNDPFANVLPIEGTYPVEYAEVKREHVNGKIFINNRHEEICIGMSKQVQDLIGLPFEVYDNMNKEIKSLSGNYNYVNKLYKKLDIELEKYKKLTFFKRLKFLFTNKV